MSLSAILNILADISGRRAPRVKLPYWPILAMSCVNECLATYISGKPPSMPLAAVRMARKYMYFDNRKAVHELGLTLTPARQALEDAVEWFQERGYV